MTVSEEIIKIEIGVGDEFRVCPVCGYDRGFHVSFLKSHQANLKIILICPDCGSRFDTGWKI